MAKWALVGVITAVVIGLSGCDQLADSLGESDVVTTTPDVPEPASDDNGPELLMSEFARACESDSREGGNQLGETRRSNRAIAAGDTDVTLREWTLPSVGAERINASAEICPGWLVAVSNGGQSFLINQDTGSWLLAGVVAQSGTIDAVSSRGIDSGGPSWGIRDVVVSGENVFYSVGVVDEARSCARMEVRHIATESLWRGEGEALPSRIVYSSEPCIDFSDERREKAPLKIHLGGALAHDQLTDTVFLTIGDYHLGASRISQAAGAGIESTELDYDILLDPDAAVSALVAISPATGPATAEVYSKGLRNSLGLTHDGDGRLWSSEMGPGGGDELNVMFRGADYGWPLTSPGEPYDRSQWPANREDLPAPYLDFTDRDIPGTADPVRVWTPAIAPSSLVWMRLDGAGLREFGGMLALATLRDQAIHILDITREGIPTHARIDTGERLRHMTVTVSGHLWAVSDSGTLLEVSPR